MSECYLCQEIVEAVPANYDTSIEILEACEANLPRGLPRTPARPRPGTGGESEKETAESGDQYSHDLCQPNLCRTKLKLPSIQVVSL